MKTINYRCDAKSYVYGWGHISNLVRPALDLINAKAKALGIALQVREGVGGFVVSSGVVVVNGVHYRGSQRGINLVFHSGWNPATRSYSVSPFKSVEAFAKMLWHETLHFYFFTNNRHSTDSSCMMHALASNWPCPAEANLMRQRWGTVTPDRDPSDQVRKLKAERQSLWYDRQRINERIKEIDQQLEEIENSMTAETRLSVSMSMAEEYEVGEPFVSCCSSFEL